MVIVLSSRKYIDAHETKIALETGRLGDFLVSFWVSAYLQGRSLTFREGTVTFVMDGDQ